MHSMLIQTFLTNLKPHLQLTVRQMISEWPSLTKDQFQAKLMEKDAAGCLEIVRPKEAHYQTQDSNCPSNQPGGGVVAGHGRSRGKGRGNSFGRKGNNRKRPAGCFNCGKTDHWVSQCPYPPRQNTPHDTQVQDTQPYPQHSQTSDLPPPPPPPQSNPRFPIAWGQQTPH
uniref:CCHC-type domain-containing protein n=1 Tax=Pyxicephalus adspersus TaxID=30357 RepID=A0AAV3B2G7_PYXAD|nr:TPA: hypothetical protein GDO54_002146 [Pyxicephalus adspersus]